MVSNLRRSTRFVMTYFSHVPVGKLFVEQLLLVLLCLLADAKPTARDASRLILGKPLSAKTFGNRQVIVPLLLHVDNHLIFLIKINSDRLKARRVAAFDTSVHLESLMAFVGHDLLYSDSLLRAIAHERVCLGTLWSISNADSVRTMGETYIAANFIVFEVVFLLDNRVESVVVWDEDSGS